ncbi:MAG: ABC transporter substrate-binding protein [Deltaproteobacteria bacterium]|jgi:iron complex transport system substrate-binding protein|nr:ABC transporter substrate-binding protein [Deltaproteobacteria bacterium]
MTGNDGFGIKKIGSKGLVFLLTFAVAFVGFSFLPAPFGGSGELRALEKKNKRIISLYAAHTEVLIRLGARDSLVGVSLQETYDGPEVRGWTWPEKFSVQDDVEKFLVANPDIVLIRPQHLGSNSHLFDSLKNSGIEVWVKQTVDHSDLYDYWAEIGAICGLPPETAAKLVSDFKEKLVPYEAYGARTDKPGVFLESVHREIKTFTPESIPVWVLNMAGGKNVAGDAEAARKGLVVANYGPEKLLEKADLVDVFISQNGPMNTVPLEVILSRDIYQLLPAFRNERVYKIPEELISRPTPSLLKGIELMHRMLYPNDPVTLSEDVPLEGPEAAGNPPAAN